MSANVPKHFVDLNVNIVSNLTIIYTLINLITQIIIIYSFLTAQDECNVQKLAFNGGYNCNGDANSFSCTLNCPPGVDFTFSPALQYICTYDKGIFLPEPIPQCKTGSDYQIVPIESSQNSFIKITNHSWIIQGTSISKLSSVNQSENDISTVKKSVSTKH